MTTASGLARALDPADRSARAIAATISRLITSGELAPGSQLPTVRSLAADLGVSPSTVSQAWRALAATGAITTGGRLGTTVVGPPSAFAPRRYRGMTEAPGRYALDLSTGTPDPELLPDLSAPLARVSRRTLTSSYLDEPVLPELRDILEASWPFTPAALTVVDGALDALDRLVAALVRFGDRVVVEDPCFPPLLDLLEQTGAEVIGVPVDDSGLVPSALTAALAGEPVALFLQPRGHNPYGCSLTAERARALARALARSETWIIEDDHAGDIAVAPLHSLGAHHPDRTVLIRSYSKSHGPDLRLAAVGGARDPIARLVQRRQLGAGWSSRMLQAVLAEMLADPAVLAQVEAARDAYQQRRRLLASALTERGVVVHGDDGINLWVEVADEREAQLGLAARGIGVAPGTPFLVGRTPADHLRLTVSPIREPVDDLAELIAAAARPTTRFDPAARR